MQKKPQTRKKPIIVATSGGFDPVHIGHVRLIQEGSKLGDRFLIILNNDHWLRAKKGYVFMSQQDRKEILLSIKGVDDVIITSHKPNDMDCSVLRELRRIKPHFFVNGGDTSLKAPNGSAEALLCKELGTQMLFGVGRGGKVRSSSELVARAQVAQKKKKSKV